MNEVDRLFREGAVVAFPTECTYEVAVRLTHRNEYAAKIQTLQEASNSTEIPHIYVPANVSDSSFLTQELPPRHYALRSGPNKMTSLHTFSEGMQVLKRISSKVWPGPVPMYISVFHDGKSPLTLHKDAPCANPHFLALRCPSHPLAVKALQSNHSSGFPLIGLPWWSESRSGFVTRAHTTATVEHCLNGEATEELFSVPTCEHRHPSSTSIWIYTSQRRIVIVNADKHISSAVLRKVLRRPAAGDDAKDRMIQAVLNKWRITVE